jgi:hypothetical protein
MKGWKLSPTKQLGNPVVLGFSRSGFSAGHAARNEDPAVPPKYGPSRMDTTITPHLGTGKRYEATVAARILRSSHLASRRLQIMRRRAHSWMSASEYSCCTCAGLAVCCASNAVLCTWELHAADSFLWTRLLGKKTFPSSLSGNPAGGHPAVLCQEYAPQLALMQGASSSSLSRKLSSIKGYDMQCFETWLADLDFGASKRSAKAEHRSAIG